jgi:hypothetical protein
MVDWLLYSFAHLLVITCGLVSHYEYGCGYLGQSTWLGWSSATPAARRPAQWRQYTEKGGNINDDI